MKRRFCIAVLMVFLVGLLVSSCDELFGPGTPDPEDEGTQASPVTLSVGTPHSGSVAKNGDSYYTFSVTVDSIYTVSISELSYGDVNVWVYKTDAYSSAQKYGESTLDSTSNRTIQFTAENTAVYIHVNSGYVASKGASYTITVTDNT